MKSKIKRYYINRNENNYFLIDNMISTKFNSITELFNYINNLNHTAYLFCKFNNDFEDFKYFIGTQKNIINRRMINGARMETIFVSESNTAIFNLIDEKQTRSFIYRNSMGFLLYFKDISAFVDLKENTIWEDINEMEELFETFTIKKHNNSKSSLFFSKFKTLVPNFNNHYKDKLTLKEFDKISQWSQEGFSYGLNNLNNTKGYDINKLYTYIMQNTKTPINKPIKCDFNNCNHYSFLKIKLTASIKKGYIPFIGRLKENNIKNDIIYITKEIWKKVKKYYNLESYILLDWMCFEYKIGVLKKEPDWNNKYSKSMINSSIGMFFIKPLLFTYDFFKVKDNQKDEFYNQKIINNNKEYNRKALNFEFIDYESRYGRYYIEKEYFVEKVENKDFQINYAPFQIAIVLNAQNYMIDHIQNNAKNIKYIYVDCIYIDKNAEFIGPIGNNIGEFKIERR